MGRLQFETAEPGVAIVVLEGEHEFLRARDRAAAAGVPFSIVLDDSTGEPVRRMFEITGLASVLPIVHSRAEALPHAS